MNAAVVKRTQEALGKVIRRPPLTEKLLSKPPFRYLHDVITEVIRMTGFMKGLYTDAEMKSDNVKDKEAKISFLQKAIDVVAMVSGEPLSAKPARIVAGHEPERTNELLQRIGKCCLSKLPSDEAVKRVLAGEKGDEKGRTSLTSKSQALNNRDVRGNEPGHKDKEERRNSDMKERRSSRDGKQKEELGEESRPRAKGRDRERTKERGHDRRQDAHRDRARAGESERARNRAQQHGDRDRGSGDRSRDPERARERRSEGGRDKDRQRVRNGEPSRDPDRERSREQDNLEKKSPSPGEAAERLADGSFKDSKAETEAEISPRASRSVTTKTSQWRSRNSVEGTRDASADSASVSEDNATGLWRENIEPEPAAKQKEGEVRPSGRDEAAPPASTEPPDEAPPHARRIPRPGSARPAPPRVKRQESSEVLPTDRSGSAKPVSNVIIDSQNSDNEEDSQFVVEAAPQLSETAGLEMVQAVEFEEDEKHGGLVKKILETKKDYEKVQQSPKPGEKEKLVFESAWKKEKDIVSKEIEKLRVSIQTVCKSALPLGKMMDYIQEDVDAMQNELQVWSSENKQLAEALRQEQSITDGTVEPLKAELAELEQLIRDQRDRICAVKASILRNEEKIQKMVYSINLSSRR
ncbi:TRAF3-interacting protein 1 isoform X1 [Manis pentadactyla]|uniref:TRAF3-interacting protein 1 isoform X1 n=1 Tax=Manis pentadactyla TaxID=143292 RepID=UPI00255CC683|nr:TRAF3-interacting protein 1 isoform X1 [Manis pentadactyla]